MLIIGLAGRLMSGKDSAAKLLVEKLGFTRMAFADMLKDFTANMLGVPREGCDDQKMKAALIGELFREPQYPLRIDDDKGPEEPVAVKQWLSLRWFLQRVGTEGGRKTFGDDFWIKMLFEKARREGVKRLVIPDVRFFNEAQAIRGRKGGGDWSYLFRCNRADMERQHDFLGTVQDGKCHHLNTDGDEWCLLPPESHPSAWSGPDRHPSETELPIRNCLRNRLHERDLSFYDLVVETDNAEKTAAAIYAAVTVALAVGPRGL